MRRSPGGRGDPRGARSLPTGRTAVATGGTTLAATWARMPSPWSSWVVVLARHWEPLGVEQGIAAKPRLCRRVDRRSARGLPAVPVDDLPAAARDGASTTSCYSFRPRRRSSCSAARPGWVSIASSGSSPGRWARSGGDPQAVRLSRPWVTHDPRVSRPGSGVHAAARRGLVPLDADHDAARLDRRVDGRASAPGHGHQRHPARSTWSSARSAGSTARSTRRPISMVETIVSYKSEYITDESGHRTQLPLRRGRRRIRPRRAG